MAAALALYHTPGTCSRVVLNALEELGLDYADEPINIFRGEQRGPAYLAVNPKGKVPALLVNGRILTEAPAILHWLDAGSGRLLPMDGDFGQAIALGELIWCADTLHPLVRMVLMPQRVSPSDPESVREGATHALSGALERIDQRLAGQPCWLGDQWSIIDVYLSWIAGMSRGAVLQEGSHPNIAAHGKRVTERESYRRAHAREAAALERSGIELPGGARL